jgi:hypothetical protein
MKNIIKMLLLLIIIAFVSLVAFSCGIDMRSINTRQTVNWSEWVEMENIDFRGVDENSTPMAASNLRVLQRERPSSGSQETNDYTYTIVGILHKTSTNYDESFFNFDVTLLAVQRACLSVFR